MARWCGRYGLAFAPATVPPVARAPVSVAEGAHRRPALPATAAAGAAAALGVMVTPVRPVRGAGHTLQGHAVWRGAQNAGAWRSAVVSRGDPGASGRLQPLGSRSRSLQFLAWGSPCGSGENVLGLAITSQAKTRQHAQFHYCLQRPLRNRSWLNAAISVARGHATVIPSATPTTLRIVVGIRTYNGCVCKPQAVLS